MWALMKKILLIAALFVSGLLPVYGSSNPDAQQLLPVAQEQSSLFHGKSKPFQLEVDFTAQINIPVQGHLTLKWESENRWWRKIVLGDYGQIDVRNGERQYIVRNLGFTPMRISDLIGLLDFAEKSDLIVKKQKRRIEDGVEVTCMQIAHEYYKSKPSEICLNAASHDIRSIMWEDQPHELNRKDFSDYIEFEGHRYPRHLELHLNGSKVLEAHVRTLAFASFDDTLLIPPKGAIERRHCAEMKHAIALKTPEPIYPKSASQNKLGGDTSVALTIEVDGSVSNVQLIGRASHSMDEATVETLKKWKFNPAMCGAEPVVSDIVVVVSFRIR